MAIRRYILLLFVLQALFFVWGCEKTYVTDENGSKGYTGINEDADDYTGSSTDTVFIVFSNNTVTSTDIKKTEAKRGVITIMAGGTYCISGSTPDGRIIVNSADSKDVRLVLRGADISCFSGSPLYVKDACKVIIVTCSGTVSHFSDGSLYSFDDPENQEPNGCIFSKSDLTFYGYGSLTVTGNFKYGINSKDGLIIKSGTIDVTSVKTGIRGKDYILVYDGNISVSSLGDGLKSDNAEDKGAGFVMLKGGTFNLITSGDAVSAYSDITADYAGITVKSGGGSGTSTLVQGYDGATSAKGFKAGSAVTFNGGNILINSADVAIRANSSFEINGGSLRISSKDDAVHSGSMLSVKAGTINVTKAFHGLKSPSVAISGGTTVLTTTENSIYCTRGFPTGYDDGSLLTVSGGTTVLNPLLGTGLFCNGSADIAGGTVIIQGPPASPALAADVKGSFDISGGILIASGPGSGDLIRGPSAASAQNSILINGPSSDPLTATTFSFNDFLDIRDINGNDLVTFRLSRSAYYIIFSSPSLVSGSEYLVYTGGQYSGGTNTYGYFHGGTYTPGALKKSFTLTGGVTDVNF